ncbi:MAG: S41 family peptidase [Bacteroidales bacterium]|nr:S41 family peptidase [Bacteroidales bacterium]
MRKIISFTSLKVRILAMVVALQFAVPIYAQNDFEIAKNVDIFVTILRELNAKYADEISPGDLTQTAIDAMLASLDPYTVYYPESQLEDYKMMTTGQYGGIGALIQQRNNQIVISEIYESFPAHKSGLLAGDIILKVNGKSTEGKSTEDVSSILKGQPGSSVILEIQRPSKNKTMSFNIERKEVKLPNIPYYGMLDNQVGYIKLDQFTERAGAEVKEAFLDLKKQGMTHLILDLRNNGGGLLQEAVNIMNIFVDQNTIIATTKGKIPEQNNTHQTRMPVTDKEIPVVVLVNEYSASASEIVSGAFQDLDRGVIVGKKTFGKGLVQNVIPLSYNTTMKLTVSKYYIPSGRCVQNIDYFHKDTLHQAAYIPDSLATPFKTKNGRTVYDKGGVEPDVKTDDLLASNVLLALVVNNLIFDFANEYHANHTAIPEASQFQVDDEIFRDFTNFLKNKEYTYTTETENYLKKLKQTAEEENYFNNIESLYNQMTDKIKEEKEADLMKYKEEISQYLASEIAVRYYYQKGRISNQLSTDPDVQQAKSVLMDAKRYNSILHLK